MKRSNGLHGNKKTHPQREWNDHTPEVYFKHQNFPPKTSPVVLPITSKLNHHVIYNSDVDV